MHAQDDKPTLLYSVYQDDKLIAYILPTIHIGTKANARLPKKVTTALGKSSHLVVEINLILPERQKEIEQTMLLYGIYDQSKRLKLNKKLNAQVQKKIVNMNLDWSTLSYYKPWFLTQLIQNYDLQNAGYKFEYGIEYLLLLQANKHKIPVMELQTPQQQLIPLNNIPQSQQIKGLERVLDTKKVLKTANEIQTAWQQQNEAELTQIFITEQQQFSYSTTLNDKVINLLKESSQSPKPYFIALGGLHILGDKGLLATLQQGEYHVTTKALVPQAESTPAPHEEPTITTSAPAKPEEATDVIPTPEPAQKSASSEAETAPTSES